jgi:hypothetical protein
LVLKWLRETSEVFRFPAEHSLLGCVGLFNYFFKVQAVSSADNGEKVGVFKGLP